MPVAKEWLMYIEMGRRGVPWCGQCFCLSWCRPACRSHPPPQSSETPACFVQHSPTIALMEGGERGGGHGGIKKRGFRFIGGTIWLITRTSGFKRIILIRQRFKHINFFPPFLIMLNRNIKIIVGTLTFALSILFCCWFQCHQIWNLATSMHRHLTDVWFTQCWLVLV